MAKTSNCLQLIDRMPQQDQDAILARLDALQAKGMTAKEAQLQAAIDVLAQLEREGQIRKSVDRAKFREDIPNEGWLAEKIEDAEMGGRNAFGVPRRMGSITGSFDRPLNLPTYLLGTLRGERGEQDSVREDSLEYIRDNWDEVKQEPIYVEVDPFGRAWVSEGNHRIMVARELGEAVLPTEVRYFSGGQRKAGPLNPDELLKLDERAGGIRKSPERDANFKRWTHGLPVIEADFSGTYDGGPAVFQAFHGTTHDDITEFKNIGSKEGALGQGPYFSTSIDDVNENYAGVGPDLTSRIGREIDNVAQGFDDDAWYATDVLQAYFDDNGIDTEITDDNIEELKDEHRDKAIEHAATRALKGDSDGLVMPVYVRLEKPFNMATNPTYFEMTYPVDEDGEPDYDAEPEGSAIDLINAINEVASGYNADADSLTNWVYENGTDGISAREVWDRAAKDVSELYDDSGDLISSGQFMQEVAREMGFDGLIQDADAYFGTQRRGFGGIRAGAMKGVQPDTLHIMPFDGSQVKSLTGNNGEFGESRNILKSVDRPQFYSQLQRAIEGVPDRIASMAAPQWKLWLDSNGPKQGIKKDEIEWSGIKDYLDLQGKAKLSKADLARYLDDSGVKVSEKMLGDIKNFSSMSDEQLTKEYERIRGYKPESYGEPMSREEILDELEGAMDEDLDDTKYAQYTMPGGKNYRELLITLPGGQKRYAYDAFNPRTQQSKSFSTRAEAEAFANQDSTGNTVVSEVEVGTPDYKSSHWDEANVLAHIRINDRIAQEPGYVVRNTRSGNPSEVFATREQAEAYQAKLPASVKTEIVEQPRDVRVLFVEEVQSDWGQDGLKKGFKPSDAQIKANGEKYLELRKRIMELRKQGFVTPDDGTPASEIDPKFLELRSLLDQEEELRKKGDFYRGLPPSAPFVTKTEGWLNLALKRIAMLAVEGGYDKVAFVNGEQSADRYGMSKQVDEIAVPTVNDDGTRSVRIDPTNGTSIKLMVDAGGVVTGYGYGSTQFSGKTLDEVIGKELADKVMQSKAGTVLNGDGLKVGGKGMVKFYDEIVPQALNKLLPKLGGDKLGSVVFGGEDVGGRYVVFDEDSGERLFRTDNRKEANEYRLAYSGDAVIKEVEGDAGVGLIGEQPGFDVTDKMRETVGQGLSLFSRDRFVEAEKSELYQKRTAKDVGLISDKDAMAALETDATSVRIMDKGYQVKPGELVGARLNLNVLKNTKVPVMTLHKATNTEGYKNNRGFYRGEAVQYKPAVTLRNAYFNVDQTGRENIAAGTQNKFPMASVDGEFVDAKPNFDGVEVSFNPARVHLFVDAKGRPVRSAEEISMFGTRAYARGKIEYYTADTAPNRKGDSASDVKFSRDRVAPETPEFKKWFGDSKVVDAEGKPMTVYRGEHGEGNDIDFQPRLASLSFGTREVANAYAMEPNDSADRAASPRLYPVYLRIENPLMNDPSDPFIELGDVADKLGMEVADSAARKFSAEIEETDNWQENFGDEYDSVDQLLDERPEAVRELYTLAWRFFDAPEFVNAAKNAGYDGAIHAEYGVHSENEDGAEYKVFDQRQVKSATGNNGEFDGTTPDIRKSNKRKEAGEQKPWFDDLAKLKVSTNYQLGDLLKTSKKLSWWDRTVGTPYNLAQKQPQFKRVFDAVQRFIGDVSAYATHAADLAPNFLPKLESWKDIAKTPLSAEDVKALRSPIFGGTLNYTRDEDGNIIETDDVSTAGVVFKDEELRQMFGLDDRQIGLYREFRRATNKSLSDMAVSDMLRYLGTDGEGVRQRALDAKNLDGALNAMVAHLDQLIAQNPKRAEVLESSKKAIKEKAGQAISLMARGYAPLSRFGQYTVDVVDQSGDRLYFSMFEDEKDAQKMARELKEQYPEADVKTGTMSQESYKLFSGVTPETLALFGESLGLEESSDDAKSQIFQEYLKAAKTNRSAMKRLIQRKGIDGFSEDAGRVLAGFVYSNARQISTNLHAGEIGRSAAAVTDGDVKDAAIRLMEYVQNPREEAQALRGLMFTQFIGGSIASAMVNLTQPFTMTLPYLSQFAGAIGAGKLMTDAVKLASRGIRNDDDLVAALKRGEDEGTVSPQEVHQLMAQAQGQGKLQSGDGTTAGDTAAKVNNGLAKLGLAWGKVFSSAEQFNRRVTFIAAYKMAREKGMENPYAFAVQAISETQGVYNKGNKPAWARGAVGGTLFTFKQYSIGYVEFLRRMWGNGPEGKKAVGLALGVLFMMSGLGGMPGADDLDDVIDGFLQRVLGRSFDTKQAKKEFFASILGQAGAEFVMSGISGIPGMPIDVANRMGLGNLIPGTGLFTKKRDYGRDYLEIAGPAGTLFTNAGLAVAALASGDARKAAEALSPVAVQNALKAKDMAEMGFYRDQKGRKVIDTDGYDVVAKALGFQPRAVAQVQEATGTQSNLITQNKLRETEIADKWAAGRIERDTSKVEEAKQMLADWNRNNPESKISIDANQINKRVQEANKTKAQRVAATAPKEIRSAVKKELETN